MTLKHNLFNTFKHVSGSFPSFLKGMARNFDFTTQLDQFKIIKNPTENDAKAIYNDWSITGMDIKEAVDQYKEQT